jgi:hypothetical protein
MAIEKNASWASKEEFMADLSKELGGRDGISEDDDNETALGRPHCKSCGEYLPCGCDTGISEDEAPVPRMTDEARFQLLERCILGLQQQAILQRQRIEALEAKVANPRMKAEPGLIIPGRLRN